MNSLTNEHYQNYDERITDGIKITEWSVHIENSEEGGGGSEDSSELLHFSVWDFAGQTVYYNTHQVRL